MVDGDPNDEHDFSGANSVHHPRPHDHDYHHDLRSNLQRLGTALS